MDHDSVVITGFARTPLGHFQGTLKSLSATNLGSVAIDGAVKRSNIDTTQADEVIMGCVLSAGLGQAPARHAAIEGGVPLSTGCTTINKMCGSGMKAIMFANGLIKARLARIVIAGGMESMTNAPYLILNARAGLRFGHSQLLDHMFFDGLQDPIDEKLMGCYAEDCANHFEITRMQQDQFAKQSLERAQTAIKNGYFEAEIVPIAGTYQGQSINVKQDEHPMAMDIDKIIDLKPVFKPDGTVTAATSSCISDGAAALVLMAESDAISRRLRPLAKIIGQHTFAQHPAKFTSSPIFAIEQLLEKLSLGIDDIDLFEINEAFAVVVLAAAKQLNLDMDKVNVHGGACALGHPIGASGARIVVTLLAALERYGLHRGLAAICIGGGEATALVIER